MLSFNFYGIFVAVASLLGLVLTACITKEDIKAVTRANFYVLLFGFLCSRAVFVIVNIDFYFVEISSPLAVFNIADGGLSFFGALLGISIALSYISRKKFISNINKFKDSIACSLWAFIFIIRIAEGYNELGTGRVVDFNNFLSIKDYYGFNILGVYRLEYIFALIMFVYFLYKFIVFYKKKSEYKYPYILYKFFIVFCSAQIVFESLRNDGHMLLGFVHIQEVLFTIMLIATICYLYIVNKKENAGVFNKLLLTIIILFAICIFFVMEFVIDGRLHLQLNIGVSAYARNYIILSIASLVLMIIGLYQIKTLKASSL